MKERTSCAERWCCSEHDMITIKGMVRERSSSYGRLRRRRSATASLLSTTALSYTLHPHSPAHSSCSATTTTTCLLNSQLVAQSTQPPMDGNNQSNNGVFSHILDPHLGQVIHGLVRSFLPQHDNNAQATEAASSTSTQTTEATDMPHLEPAAPIHQQAVEMELVSGPGGPEAHVSMQYLLCLPRSY